jgi:Tat protein translocase TatB subunit
MELSFSEILVVCLIAFLVFGPEDFIRRSRQFGEWMGKMRTQAQNFRVMAEEEITKNSGIKEVREEVARAKESLSLEAPRKKPENGDA